LFLLIGVQESFASVGMRECGPYHLRDTRPQPPKASILEASLDYISSGYVLSLRMSDQKEVITFNLNSKLALDERRSYSDPLEIAVDGKFKISINGRSNWCSYTGVAKISPQASRLLFSANSANAQTLELNNSSILGRWSLISGADDAYSGVITIENDKTFTFAGFYSPDLKSDGTWSFDVKSQKLTLEFADKLRPFWNSNKKIVNVLNDYKRRYEISGFEYGNKCEFIIDFGGYFFRKLSC
jgi:hypothetical protein